tara:strand:- start:696 stop:908 length:213 start_codon:yes stop_codon:yes gene_type:complete
MAKTLDVYLDSGVNVSLTKDWHEQAIKKFIQSLNNREVSFDYKIYNDADGTFLAIEDEDELEKIIERENK